MYAPGVGIHPDLPNTFVHFTGRPRMRGDVPPVFVDERLGELVQAVAKAAARFGNTLARAEGAPVAADSSAEERLISILVSGKLKGAKVFGTSQPVICFSEPSEEARRIMLRDGVVASRGPYAPWGLLFNREALIGYGVRPVLYLSTDEMEATDDLPVKLRNRRVRYDPGSADWLHEREWRLCFEDEEQSELQIIPDLVAGVIVGRQGWEPPVITLRSERTDEVTWSSRSAHGLTRWWWDGENLIEDGTIDTSEADALGDD